MVIPVKNLNPYTISDTGLLDEDSGLHQFRGMITPWEQIKSFRETIHFMWRHSALMGVGFMNAFKIIEPDYEKRQTTMSSNWGAQMQYMWSSADPMGILKDFESRHDIPPFMKKSLYRSASYCDNGDEFTGMPGYSGTPPTTGSARRFTPVLLTSSALTHAIFPTAEVSTSALDAPARAKRA